MSAEIRSCHKGSASGYRSSRKALAFEAILVDLWGQGTQAGVLG